MKTRVQQAEPYLEMLRDLPFIRSAEVVAIEENMGGVQTDATVEVVTEEGTTRLYLEMKLSHLTYGAADQVIHTFSQLNAVWMLAAPHIGGPLGRYLCERGVNYLDRQGNCYLNLGDRFVASVEGHTPRQPPASFKGVRAAGYRVLFAYLAEIEMAAAPIRDVTRAAGVSRQAVLDMRNRLVHEGVFVKAGLSHHWIEPRRKDALNRWLVGYSDVVRPSLLVGRYRTPYTDPRGLEARLVEVFGQPGDWRYGGCAAGFRMTGTYRGRKTIVHSDGVGTDQLRKLKAVPSADGPLVLLRFPGAVSRRGATDDTVHPLLVYSEMLHGGERSREAARDVYLPFIETS